MQTTLKGNAKTDGEDLLTPMIQQAANSILTESIKKQ
jgi:hypothetical protein